ncbi:HEAT repeat domain-containing protein [Streptomyces silvensis]|uniref:PBS lyase n=1 Tax=Streptomyces silvensis TaxID=1765722 RepID=A0A0W7XBC5_9ACTN|nr:HEAT repeat domain-containing protein [Streptomyces silvensis]KUF20313.1 hypothetical protein AT728_40840 [Streptomyces silvensis]
MDEFPPVGELVDMRLDGDVAGLCRVTRAEDHRRAVQAVDLLGGMAAPEAADALIDCCGREGERYRGVRMSAVRALGKRGERRAVPVLVGLLNRGRPVDDPHINRGLYRALTTIGGPEAVAGLLDALEASQTDGHRAEQIVDALADLRSPESVPGLLAALWQFLPIDPLPVVRALGAIGDPRAGAALLVVADAAGTRPDVRRAAVEALHLLPWPPPVQTTVPERLLSRALRDQDHGTVHLAAELLSQTFEGRTHLFVVLKRAAEQPHHPECPPHTVVAACDRVAELPTGFAYDEQHLKYPYVSLLTSHLRESAVPAVRRAAARALGALAGGTATADLLDALDDPQATEAVAHVLAGLPEPPVHDLLARLTDATRSVPQRRGSALALSLTGPPEAAAPLLAVLADDAAPTAVRASAADALGTLRHTGAAGSLAAVTADEEQPGALRARAVRALGLIGAPDTLPVVLACVRSPHETIRERAVQALGSFPVPEAAAVLGELVDSRDSRTEDDDGVALAALYALDRMGGPALPVLTALVDRVSPDLAGYLVGALADRPEPEATAALGRLATTRARETYPSQVYAAEKLSERRSPEAVAPLRALVVNDGYYGPTYAAGLRGLTAIGTEEAVEHVLAYCRETRYLHDGHLYALNAIAAARAEKDVS